MLTITLTVPISAVSLELRDFNLAIELLVSKLITRSFSNRHFKLNIG